MFTGQSILEQPPMSSGCFRPVPAVPFRLICLPWTRRWYDHLAALRHQLARV